MDVLEIDAATNTQIDKVRDVIITGLGIAPVRDRYKVFIIDEVHRLSPQSFDALLKSIEEPPPHVIFMMATTEIGKVPPTIQSRSQVVELKAIGVKAIADQVRPSADAERQALLNLSRRFSGEDLMRAFDVLSKAEVEIRASMQPRYHLEMALLRWLHLRKLVPLTDLIEQMKGGGPVGSPVGPTFRSGAPSRPDLKVGPTG